MANNIGVQDIRAGTAFMLDGQPYIGLKYEHIKMGRGSATIKIKARDVYDLQRNKLSIENMVEAPAGYFLLKANP